MNDDDYPVDAAWYEMQLLEREWLEELARDEAKRAEFERWLASTHTEGNERGIERNEDRIEFRDDASGGASGPLLPGHRPGNTDD